MRTSVALAGVGTTSCLAALALGIVTRNAVVHLVSLPVAAWGPDQLATCVVAVAAAAGTLGTLWHLGSVLLACVALMPTEPHPSVRTDRGRQLALALLERWGAPVVRRAVIGTVLSGLLLPATATAASAAPSPAPDDLGWAPAASAPATDAAAPESEPSPTTATAESAAPDEEMTTAVPDESSTQAGHEPSRDQKTTATTEAADDGAQDQSTPSRAPERRTVTAGDSLWTITSDLLGADAPDTRVAVAWPELYRANAERIGDDPGLIRPGTELVIPTGLTSTGPSQPS
ncbi:LysM peptidoglycan-binding domain-containing protein [Actinomyces haliotis]|uniref:LysM peptidoglycan-binding domain-containing protein n=1 Tax=Actinomyces haliotis TaxID=1280843 RepID=UPI00188F4393|nr:LysM peptidoglycan-binding domain-containing protein [Actinomyces haliotis]